MRFSDRGFDELTRQFGERLAVLYGLLDGVGYLQIGEGFFIYLRDEHGARQTTPPVSAARHPQRGCRSPLVHEPVFST